MTHLSNNQIKELGEALIAGYYKDYGILFTRCVDIIEFAEHLGLTVVFESFAEDDPEYQRIYVANQPYSGKELHQHFHMVENRADRLAAHLLMPESIVLQALTDFHNGDPIPVYGQNLVTPEEYRIVNKMADQMEVSYSALMIRLKELRLISYRPQEEYTEAVRQEGWM